MAETENYYVTRNLSEKGCQIVMKPVLEPGTDLTLLLHLPANKAYQTKAVVRHSSTDTGVVGIEFVETGILPRIYISFLKGLRALKTSKEFYDAV